MKFYYKLLLNLPKNLRRRTQTSENTKKWPFFITLNFVKEWLLLKLHEMIIMSHAIKCPIVFIFLWNLG